MKDFKSQTIDTPGVIDRVSNLFRGHPTLVTGFNTFLPPGYRIEATSDPLAPIRVIYPAGVFPVSSAGLGPTASAATSAPPPGVSSRPPSLPPPATHSSSPNVPHYGIPQQMQQQHQQQPHAPPQGYYPSHLNQHVQPVQPGPGYQTTHQLPPPSQQQQQQQLQPMYAPQVQHQPQHTIPQQPPQPVPLSQPQVQLVEVPSGAAGGPKKAPVEFSHAISYVNKIKNRFASDPDTYKQFLEILQTYQKESKPIREVYAQVQILFKSAPDLLDEFKHFLPEVNAIIPQGQQAPGGPQRGPPMGNFASGDPRRLSGTNMPQPPAAQPKKQTGKRTAGVFSGPPQVYPPQSATNPQQAVPIGAVQSQVAAGQQPPKKRKYDTSSRGAGNTGGNQVIGGYVQGGPVAPGLGTSSSTFPGDQGSVNNAYNSGGAVPQLQLPPPGPNGNVEELEWIDRCKRSIGNKATYNEFLKVLNLFSNEIIDSKTLVERVEPFLAKSPDLFQWFKKFVKYEEEQIVYNYPAQRPEIDPRTCRKSGHSYRQLPDNYPRSQCSGRDDLCREVLNDDWISQPEYLSETGFIAHKKTIYEEALHKCEEERYEFDMNIEANLHTIALLEPIYRRIQAMSAEERAKFKLPVGLGGTSKTIYQRVIKKIYDTDKGLEVIDALHNNPSVAVPVVLKRLKQKDEEWKRCQRDWNKVWREVDVKNYHKALDHQGIHFKGTDRKQLTMKALTSEIENLYREQQERKRNHQVTAHYGFHSTSQLVPGHLSSSAYTRHQMDFVFPDPLVFRDARRLVLMQVGVTSAIGQGEEERIGEFLSNFMRRFFCLEAIEGTGNGAVVSDENEAGDEDDGGSDVNGGGAGKSVHTLRKEVLLKQGATAAGGGSAAGGEGNGMDIDAMSDTGESTTAKITSTHVRPVQKREYYPFFANTTFYVFFRLYEILCVRLRKMKELSDHFQKDPPHHTSILNPIAVNLGLQSPDSLETVQPKGKDRYTDFIRAVHDLFDSKIEATEFEDRLRGLFGTSAYLSYTIDKLVQSIVKQIQSIISDSVCLDLVDLYFRDREKPVSSSRQESVYRLNAERVVEDDALYRLEYHVSPRVLTFQLINKDDPVIHEGSSVEEKWSVYVDQFIQLSSSTTASGTTGGAGGIYLLRRSKAIAAAATSTDETVQGTEPFLRRNLPIQVPLGPLTGDIVVMKSGLELKICLNTYKMFFVEDTEDYFARRKVSGITSVGGRGLDSLSRKRRAGWDKELRGKANAVRLDKFAAWLEKRGQGIAKDEAEWVLVDRALAVGGDRGVDKDGDVEMN
ncbi:UNVERIFIED_CONTAM: Transcriptional regulatory protein sin3 [Siphonaria sp. JEL0065]|nr:Transcriptional regulatory protein sin3 [Siphonaria sp. JEL0065]